MSERTCLYAHPAFSGVFTFNPWGGLQVVWEPGVFPPPDPPAGLYVREVLERDEVLARFAWIKPEGVRGEAFESNVGFIDPDELIAFYRRLLGATATASPVVRTTSALIWPIGAVANHTAGISLLQIPTTISGRCRSRLPDWYTSRPTQRVTHHVDRHVSTTPAVAFLALVRWWCLVSDSAVSY